MSPPVPANPADLAEERGGTKEERRVRHVDRLCDPTTGQRYVSANQQLTAAILRAIIEQARAS